MPLLDQRMPERRLLLDERRQLRPVAGRHFEAEGLQARLDLGREDSLAHLGGQARGDGGRRALGREQALPGHGLEVLQRAAPPASASVGTSGSSAMRWLDSTASAFSLPLLICARPAAVSTIIIGTWPLITSCIAGAVPR